MNVWHCRVSLSKCTCRIWTSWMPMTVIRMWLSFRPQNITLRPIASCKSKGVLIEVATPTFCIYSRHVWIQGVPLNPAPSYPIWPRQSYRRASLWLWPLLTFLLLVWIMSLPYIGSCPIEHESVALPMRGVFSFSSDRDCVWTRVCRVGKNL